MAAPHFGFAGHLDVVPPGDGWDERPVRAGHRGRRADRPRRQRHEERDRRLRRRGRVDASRTSGTLSLLITGDEEGYATYGTPRIIDWLNERGIRPDMILIGEPTSVDRLGDTIKIGRRGSVNMWIDVPGTQGHVAYPHRADNPMPKLARIIAALDALHLDDGTDAFPPSNLEFTGVSTPTHASNVIPASATAQLNIRFNNLQRGADLVRLVEEIAEREAPGSTVRARISGEAFLTPPGELYDVVVSAIREETGHRAGAVDQRRHVGRALPDRALPGGRFRPAQRHDAQGRRACRGRGHSGLSRIYRRVLEKVFA